MSRQAFEKTIADVEAIDPQAAEWLRSELRKRDRGEESIIAIPLEHPGDIEASFIWGESPQGHRFWRSIYSRITAPLEEHEA